MPNLAEILASLLLVINVGVALSSDTPADPVALANSHPDSRAFLACVNTTVTTGNADCWNNIWK